MAKPNRRLLKAVTVTLILLIAGSLIGHFIVDLSGYDPFTACGLHAGLILVMITVIPGMLTLVNVLLADAPLARSHLFPPHVQPPNSLP